MLLKHHDLGHAALAIVEQGDHSKHSVPKSISELFKVVSKTKRSLIQVFHLHVLNEWIDCTLSLQKFDSLNVHNIKWIYNAIVKKDWVFGNFYHCLERSFYLKKINQQVHQEHSRSYKEVCAPVIERCRFLFNELRPAVGNEVNAMSRSCLLKSTPRWKTVSIKMMEDKRRSKRGKGIYYILGSHIMIVFIVRERTLTTKYIFFPICWILYYSINICLN